jgi:uncharacterized membrane protein
MNPLLLIHISGATIGLISGAMSMIFRKGGSLHRLAGNVFFGSMLLMSSTAAYYAAFVHPIALNVTAATLTFYLVSTAWWVAHRRDGRTSAFDYGALLFVALVVMRAFLYGVEAANSVGGRKDHMPAAGYFIFGSIALLFGLSDVRMLIRGGVSGAKRIARHLWRMCFALLITALSFYPGQAKLVPAWRGSFLPFIPVILLVIAMFYWLIRVSFAKRLPAAQPLP